MTARIGYGTVFAYESATPGTYTTLGEVTEITPPSLTRETVDATTFEAPSRYRQRIAGMRDQGEATVTFLYDPGDATWDAIKAAYEDNSTKNWKITFPDSESVIFPALVTDVSVATPLGDKMTLSVKLQPTGAATWS